MAKSTRNFRLGAAPEARRTSKFAIEACGSDNNLQAEVESLLSSLAVAESFMEAPVLAKVADLIKAETTILEAGTCFDNYKIISQLGAGGMGEVYLAEDARLNRKVALKLLAAHITEDKSRVSRFRQEAFATSALNHPNIVTIYEIGKCQDRDFIATEFIDGMTLRSLLQKKRLSIGESLNIALQIASAFSAAHSAGIVHRDIKPENIMIRPDGLVKVLDFGIAKYRPSEMGRRALVETEIGEIIGTVAYMSPEQARGLEVDAQTDIWSLGIILYEMLAGKLPFQGETKSDRIVAILGHDPAPLTEIGGKIPIRLRQIVDRALTKDKKQRYANIVEMTEDLRLLRETTGERLPPSLILPVRKSAALRRAYLLAAVSLFVLLTGSIGLWFYFSVNGKTSIKDARLVPAPEIKSLAVLPFKPLDAGDNYLGLGIADAMIRRISQTGRLIVRPTSAVRRYLNKETDAIAAARELEVDAVIEGAVQRVGDRIRVSINLLRTSDGASLWADRFDIGSADIFTIQDRMAQQVAAHLQLRLDSAQQGVSPSVTPLTQSPTNIT